MKINILLLIISILIITLTGCLSIFFPDIYYEKKFKKEINEDARIERLLFINSNYPRPDDDAFIIGIELNNGERIIGEAENSIYNFHEIIEIGNYKIFTVLIFYDSRYSQWSSRFSEGIITSNIVELVNNKTVSSKLNQILDCYDEIIGFLNKIYEEGPIPLGIEEGRDVDISKWGEEDELIKYTGYMSRWNSTWKMKIYVEYIE